MLFKGCCAIELASIYIVKIKSYLVWQWIVRFHRFKNCKDIFMVKAVFVISVRHKCMALRHFLREFSVDEDISKGRIEIDSAGRSSVISYCEKNGASDSHMSLQSFAWSDTKPPAESLWSANLARHRVAYQLLSYCYTTAPPFVNIKQYPISLLLIYFNLVFLRACILGGNKSCHNAAFDKLCYDLWLGTRTGTGGTATLA